MFLRCLKFGLILGSLVAGGLILLAAELRPLDEAFGVWALCVVGAATLKFLSILRDKAIDFSRDGARRNYERKMKESGKQPQS